MENATIIELLVPALISALGAFLLGILWYHPKVMGGEWLRARGKSIEDFDVSTLPFFMTFILWLLASFFYSVIVFSLDINTISGFLCLSCLLWVAFALPPTLMGALYTGYPFDAVAIDSAYQLAGYYVLAIIHIAFLCFSELGGFVGA
mgnify:CR=1 FL=1